MDQSKAEARSRAEQEFKNKLAKADQLTKDVMEIQQRRREAENVKLLRLRSLRLAKGVTDREGLAKSEAIPSKAPRKRRKQAKRGTSG